MIFGLSLVQLNTSSLVVDSILAFIKFLKKI